MSASAESSAPASPSPRIAFAHTLRGLACLLVLIQHLLFMFGCEAAAIATLTGITHSGYRSQLISTVVTHMPVNFGSLGVAVFFLVSGLVIPLSLRSNSRLSFLVARFFRIVPTYACCLLVTMTGLWAVNGLFGNHYVFPWRSALAHVAFVRDILWFPSIDGVVWTLEVEARFYLVCLLIMPLIRAADFRGILVGTAIVTGVVAWLGASPEGLPAVSVRWHAFTSAMSLSALCITFMWMGTMFSFHRHGQCTGREAVMAIALLDAMFVVQLFTGAAIPHAVRLHVLIAYQVALVVFAVGYCLPARFLRYRWLDRLADISFPLYAVHGALGYAVELLLVRLTRNTPLSIGLACVLMIMLATLVHRTVERPSQRLGKLLAATFQGPVFSGAVAASMPVLKLASR